MDRQLKKLLQNTIVVKHQTGEKTSAGELMMKDPVTYKCRIESVNAVFQDKNGQQNFSKNKIFLNGDAVISEGDLVTPQNESEGPVMKLERHYGIKGEIDHFVVYT